MTAGRNRLPTIITIFAISAFIISCQFLTGKPNATQTAAPVSPALAQTEELVQVTPVSPPVHSEPSAEPTQPAQPEETQDVCPLGDCVTSCMASIANTELEFRGKEGRIDENYYPDEPVTLTSYLVKGDGLEQYFSNNDIPAWLEPFRDDFDYHLGLWHVVAVLLPDSIRPYVWEFNITTDGIDETLASTYQSETDMNAWVLDVDILDTTDLDYFLSTVIHEFSHLITLNQAQVTPNQAVFDNPDNENVYEEQAAACPTYFPDGCSHADSYINHFYDRFWKDADYYARWEKINAMDYGEQYDNALTRFYEDFQDRFVTEYAATNIDEDMAETFTLFILEPKPAGETIAEEKILFFYEFPEMLEMRRQIASSLCEITSD